MQCSVGPEQSRAGIILFFTAGRRPRCLVTPLVKMCLVVVVLRGTSSKLMNVFDEYVCVYVSGAKVGELGLVPFEGAF